MAKKPLEIDALAHKQAKRRNIPTAEFESVMREKEKTSIRLAYERRNRDLDPQLVWRGKDEQDWSDLIVAAPPLYIQEKVHPKVLIVEIKGYRGEDAKEKVNTLRAYWVPGVNNLGKYGRWAAAEFTAVYEIESEFNKLINAQLSAATADVFV